jgi:hypothetical protein
MCVLLFSPGHVGRSHVRDAQCPDVVTRPTRVSFRARRRPGEGKTIIGAREKRDAILRRHCVPRGHRLIGRICRAGSRTAAVSLGCSGRRDRRLSEQKRALRHGPDSRGLRNRRGRHTAVDRERRAHPVSPRGRVGIAHRPTSTSPSSSPSDPHYRVFIVYLWHGQCVTRRQASTAASWIGMASRPRSRLISVLRVRTQSARRYRSPRSHPASTWSH